MVILLLITLAFGYLLIKIGVQFEDYFLNFYLVFVMLALSTILLKKNMDASIKYILFSMAIFVVLYNLIMGVKLLFNKN